MRSVVLLLVLAGLALGQAPQKPAPQPETPDQKAGESSRCFTVLLSNSTYSEIAASCETLASSCSGDVKSMCPTAGDRPDWNCIATKMHYSSARCQQEYRTFAAEIVKGSPCADDAANMCDVSEDLARCYSRDPTRFSAQCRAWVRQSFGREDFGEQPGVIIYEPATTVLIHRRRGPDAFTLFLIVFIMVMLCICCVRCRRACKRGCKRNQHQYTPVPNVEVAVGPENWSCPQCTLENNANDDTCVACAAPRTIVFSGPAPSAPMAPPSAPMAPASAPMMPLPAQMMPLPAQMMVPMASAPAMQGAVMPPMGAAAQPALYPTLYAPVLVQYRSP
jgi:hypothetical protein